MKAQWFDMALKLPAACDLLEMFDKSAQLDLVDFFCPVTFNRLYAVDANLRHVHCVREGRLTQIRVKNDG